MLFSYRSVKIKVFLESSYEGGCSKRRKWNYFLKDAIANDTNAVVTAGAANSNHAKVVALACAEQNWPCTVVVHDKEDYTKGNLLLMKLSGARLVYTDLSEVGSAMDKEMERYREEGRNPYYIYGGGHGLPGCLAFYDAATEFVRTNPDFQPDYVVHASGTGGTQAGLLVGFNSLLPQTRLLGISIARQQRRGAEVIRKSSDELTTHLGIAPVNDEKICFLDEWVGGGYGATYTELFSTIKYFLSNNGLVTDPTYTGKALHGLREMIDRGEIPNQSNVLFWHTGGLINLFEHTQGLIE